MKIPIYSDAVCNQGKLAVVMFPFDDAIVHLTVFEMLLCLSPSVLLVFSLSVMLQLIWISLIMICLNLNYVWYFVSLTSIPV